MEQHVMETQVIAKVVTNWIQGDGGQCPLTTVTTIDIFKAFIKQIGARLHRCQLAARRVAMVSIFLSPLGMVVDFSLHRNMR
jgi:hypothetical protein